VICGLSEISRISALSRTNTDFNIKNTFCQPNERAISSKGKKDIDSGIVFRYNILKAKIADRGRYSKQGKYGEDPSQHPLP
jgi:hypothetical protein